MLYGTIDLHLHTTCSDGLDTPEELIKTSVHNGYRAIAITDHDTVEGVIRGIEIARSTSLEFIPGIELSAIDHDNDVHILGYYIDHTDLAFNKWITLFKQKRKERAEEIVKSLNRLGLDIGFESVLKIAHGASIGRPHIAAALLSENLITTYNEAFRRYIGFNGPAYVPKYPVTPYEAIELILKNGGIPVIAHPGVLRSDGLIIELIDYGLMGIEVVHPLHTPEVQSHYQKFAEKHGLLVTGGSDWHGEARKQNLYNISGSGTVLEKAIHDIRLCHYNRIGAGGKHIARES